MPGVRLPDGRFRAAGGRANFTDDGGGGAKVAISMSSAEGDEFRVLLDDVRFQQGGHAVFDGLSCGFPRGKITVVLGASGAGKSTLLRMIGGLTRPDSGRVLIAGQDITELSETELFSVRDRLGMLFQGGALLDSLTIFENVALPLREHTRLSDPDIADEVRRRLEAVGLPDVDDLLPGQLSGGMKRRAALARAVVTDPEIVLVDEPFSGLDPVNVRRIENVLVDLNRRLGITLIVTSHHIASTLRMAYRMLFLADGSAIYGLPDDLLKSSDRRVTEFLSAETQETWQPKSPTPPGLRLASRAPRGAA